MGPFQTREYGSGYAFANLRIGFCASHADRFAAEVGPLRIKRAALRWGAASVECSTSGQFFRRFPLVTLLEEGGGALLDKGGGGGGEQGA